MRAALKAALLSATAEPTSERPDHLDHERLADGHVERVDDAQQERHDHHLPHLDVAQQDERAQHQCEAHGGRLGAQQAKALGQRISGQPAEQSQDHDRDELGGGHETQRDRAVRELQHQPVLRDGLHPGAGERHQLSEVEQPEVAVPEDPQARR